MSADAVEWRVVGWDGSWRRWTRLGPLKEGKLRSLFFVDIEFDFRSTTFRSWSGYFESSRIEDLVESFHRSSASPVSVKSTK